MAKLAQYTVRMPGFRILSADINEVAQQAYVRLFHTVIEPLLLKHNENKPEFPGSDQQAHWNQMSARIRWILDTLGYLVQRAPETYKLWPWLVRAWKKANSVVGDPQAYWHPTEGYNIDPVSNDKNHIRDILVRANEILGRMRDDPRPETQVPDLMRDFKEGWGQLEEWVYEQNARSNSENLQKDKPVFEYQDGWKIVQVHSDNLGWEGEQMGHCVGGYCTQVDSGDSIIYSLRDKQDKPHVTFELEGQHPVPPLTPQGENGWWREPDGTSSHQVWPWKVVQIQGKQDSKPIEEYRGRLNQFFTYLRGQGVNVEWSENAWQPGQYDQMESYIDTPEDLKEWYENYTPKQQGQQFDQYGLPEKEWDTVSSGRSLIDKVLGGLIDEYGNRSRFDPQDMAEAIIALTKEQYPDPQAQRRVIEKDIESAYEIVDRWIEDYREQNYSYEDEMKKNLYEEHHNDPNVDFNEWWDNQDWESLQEHPAYQEVEDRVADEWAEPFKRCYEFIRLLGESVGESPSTAPAPAAPATGVPGALGSWNPVWGEMPMKRSKRYGFLMVAADIAELANTARQKIMARPDIQQLPPRSHNILTNFISPEQIQDENYKLIPWAVREWKKGRLPTIGPQTREPTELPPSQHALDIINQAGRWLNWLDEYNRPGIDYMSKQFGFEQMQEWVYEMNASRTGEEGEPDDPNRVKWNEEKKVFSFPNGWYITPVSSADAGQEGQLMGHCVGGYCRAIDAGESYIYSLRDEKGGPHVTLESSQPLDPDHAHSRPGESPQGEIVQIFGKSDHEPISEYKAMLKEWFTYLQDEENFDIHWSENAIGYYGENDDGEGDPYYNHERQQSFKVESLDEIPQAYEFIRKQDMAAFHEDYYTGNYVPDPNGDRARDESYGIGGNNRQVEEVIPAPFIDLGDNGSKTLMDLWLQFLDQCKRGAYSREQIQEYVEGFYFIPITDGDIGRYGNLPEAKDYIQAARAAVPEGQHRLPYPGSIYENETDPQSPANPWEQYQAPASEWAQIPQEVTEDNPYEEYAIWYMQSLEQGYPEPNPYHNPQNPNSGPKVQMKQFIDPYQLEGYQQGTRVDRHPQYPYTLPGALSNFIHEYDEAYHVVVVSNIHTGKVVARIPAKHFWGMIRYANEWQPAAQEPVTLPTDSISQALNADPAARAAYQSLSRAGGHVYVVGGAVRDAFLGNAPKDVDLMVVGLPADEVEKVLNAVGRVDLTGKSFGVFRLKAGGAEVEVALPRSEQSTGAGHKDFDVRVDHTFGPEEDLQRRDFTANAMAYNVDTGELVDPHGGQTDLQNKVLRTVSPESFRDDPLRTVRALVANGKHGLNPDPQTLDQMREWAPYVRHLPGERIQMELDKLLSSPNPAGAIRLADEADVLDYMLPEVGATKGIEQHNPHHDLTVDQHLYEVLDNMSRLSNDPDLRLAALLHDIGKPDSMWLGENGQGHFYEHPDYPGSANHDQLGADYAEQLMKRLKYPNDRIDRVKKLIQLHMFPAFNSKKGARKFLAKAGSPKMAWDLLTLRQADLAGKGRQMGGLGQDAQTVDTMRNLLEEVMDDGDGPAVNTKDLAVNGNDLMSLGIKPGPQIGSILKELLDAVIDRPELNTKEELLGLARQMVNE